VAAEGAGEAGERGDPSSHVEPAAAGARHLAVAHGDDAAVAVPALHLSSGLVALGPLRTGGGMAAGELSDRRQATYARHAKSCSARNRASVVDWFDTLLRRLECLAAYGDASLRHCRLAMVYATSRSAARPRRSLTSRSMSWSALVAVSRQAEDTVGRTATEVTGAEAAWVTGGRVAVALAGSPPDRQDPSANPSTMPTARTTARTTSKVRRVRRGAWTGASLTGDAGAASGSG
jgi:hypothetical protein